jgi:hypothetical protein
VSTINRITDLVATPGAGQVALAWSTVDHTQTVKVMLGTTQVWPDPGPLTLGEVAGNIAWWDPSDAASLTMSGPNITQIRDKISTKHLTIYGAMPIVVSPTGRNAADCGERIGCGIFCVLLIE